MNEHDDLERTVARSLRQRTDRISNSVPDLDGVWAHVDRRRNRRRHVAAAGSLVVVAVGALGMITLGGGDPDRLPAPAAASAPDVQAAWRCTNPLDYIEEGSAAVFFEMCEAVEFASDVPLFDEAPTDTTVMVQVDPTVPVTVPGVAPAGLICETSTSDDATVTVPCVQTDATAPPEPATPAEVSEAGVAAYLVVEGDTVARLTNAFNVPPAAIAEANASVRDGETLLRPGERILVPRNGGMTSVPADALVTSQEQDYRIVAGDSVTGVAARFGFLPDTLVAYNSWSDGFGHVLIVDDVILIPPGGVILDQTVTDATTTTTTTTTTATTASSP